MSWPSRVLVLADTFGATQAISFARPLAAIAGGDTPGPEVILQPGLPTETEIPARFRTLRPEVLVLSRHTGSDAPVWIGQARAAGVPVICHLDDDLLGVPPGVGRQKYLDHNDPLRLRNLRRTLEAADLVYASTPVLAETLRARGIRTPIRAGGIYCSVDPDRMVRSAHQALTPVIGYMGTGGHAEDLNLVLPVLENLMVRCPDLQFELFGPLDLPAGLDRFGHRVRRIDPVSDHAAFLDRLRSLGWWIGLAPLQDTGFNRCKAETKWVEYSEAGMAVVASDGPVYRRACAAGCGILAGDGAAWHAGLERLLFMPALRHATIAAAQARLRAGYTHQRLRAQVMAVFETARRIAAGDRPPPQTTEAGRLTEGDVT